MGSRDGITRARLFELPNAFCSSTLGMLVRVPVSDRGIVSEAEGS